ncbi:TonB-dependent receptor [Thalassotalea sp. 1_MG-2023]|uniref:TonB-dependent receptor n=1 Tax=Thalassotalea sp. 1_MG-2023 TaxID=3062680 RepID=UPI0026E2ED36|nr:TonB-dependent receptor [Thalassotalea sp. 1_MG-2023]MDO6428637.1 TonB-dependent receptor [Thalassotalea sp. 1_MG-2023]
MIKTKRILKRSACALAVASAVAITTPAFANDAFNGTVKGVISSANNQQLAGATITLTHKTKGITRTITTDQNGNYTLRKLPIGLYTMKIEKPGFEQTQTQDLLVKVGSAIVYNGVLYSSGTDMETIQVTGSRIAPVNMDSSAGGIVITAEELERLPVETGFESIALLAPGVVGNNSFGASSVGGSSSAENAYYLNGINITSIKTGIGSISLPWEAVAQTEVMTGGIAPEFGGALGGIVNAVSKSGSNEWEFGAYGRIDPAATQSQHDNILTTEGDYFSNTEQDESTFTRASIWASGAIIEDSLFFYGIYAPQKNEYDAAGSNTIDIGENTSDRYLATLDWFINDDHSITATAIGFTNKGKGKTYANDWETQDVGEELSHYKSRSGGDIFGLTYSGILNDDMSVEVVAGRTKDKTYNTATSSDPLVWSQLTGGWVKLSRETASSITESEFVRDQFRADFSWMLEDHDIKIGFDYTNISIEYENSPNGVGDRAGWWEVFYAWANNPVGYPVGDPYIRQRVRTDFTDSEVSSSALYIQDTWAVTDQLVLNLGLRYSNVYNTVSDGRKYVDVKGQFAPRVQAIYDLDGEGTSKVYATFGRYFQPVSANMNITQGGQRRDVRSYYEVGQVDANGEVVLDADGAPNVGAFIGENVVQEGISEPTLIASQDMESMYSDEFTIGYETELMDGDLVYGIRGIYRELKRSIEDTDYAPVIQQWFADNDMAGAPYSAYVLNNPGSGLDISYDFDGDGVAERVNIPASYIGLPEPERKYGAIENTLSGKIGEKFNFNASYTWSHSWGNTEGLVRTDNGQADPGWTTSYDYAELMDHSNGNLPNDRRHSFKLNGYYQINDELTLGFNTRLTSGVPISKFSRHPLGVDSCAAGSVWEACSGASYGHVAFYDTDGNPAPRGVYGETDWLKEFDMSLAYNTTLGEGDLMLKATVYNVFNFDTQTAVQQAFSRDGDNGIEENPNWGMTTGRLGARYVSFEARYSF